MAKVFRLYFHLHLAQAMFMCVCVCGFILGSDRRISVPFVHFRGSALHKVFSSLLFRNVTILFFFIIMYLLYHLL